MNFLFACGGTAGHINPALAIAGELKKLRPDSRFLFIGAGRELENRTVPQAGFELKNITINGFSRSISLGGLKKNLKTLSELRYARRQSAAIIDSFAPDVVIGTGGYVCYPVLTAAAKKGIPTVMHESNAVPGLTAKLLSGKVDKMLVAFPNTERLYKKPARVIFTGTPVRGSFSDMTREQAKSALGMGDMPLAVSFWGSLGASGMNDMMPEFIRLNTENGSFKHIHATGGGDEGYKKMLSRLENAGVTLDASTDIRPYIDDMGTVMTAADVILCRSGASTIAEITALGRACVLVPSPYVTNDHQNKNAQALREAGCATVIKETECTGEKLYDAVLSLIRSETAKTDMERASRKLGAPEAAITIANLILSDAH